MQVSQKKSSTSTEFGFYPQGLQYSVEDANGRSSFVVPYEEIPSETSELVEKNAWLRNAAFFWLLIGVAGTVYTYAEAGAVGGYFWIIVGLITYGLYWFNRVAYSVFLTSHGCVYVIKDDEHDRIVGQILDRKRHILRERFGTIDTENDPERELRKFAWLREEGAITEDEYSNFCQRIRFDMRLPRGLRGGIHLN